MALDLARLQFALTTSFHFLFVTLTLGLAPLVAIMHTRYVLTGKQIFERMTKFWGQIYVINYALGIVVGLVLEFQFGLNWSGLAYFAGDVFGPPLAMETLTAFFIESTLLGVWIFGWGRLNKVVHLLAFWLVTITAYASAYWIMMANGFLQNPVGHVISDGVARITDLGALLTNPAGLNALYHVVAGSLVAGGLFVGGVSAWHFLRRTEEVEFHRRSMRLGLIVFGLAAFMVVGLGYTQLDFLEGTQPLKYASIWRGEDLNQLQAEMAAKYGPGDYIPPSWIGGAFTAMYIVGTLCEYLFWLPPLLLVRNFLERRRILLRIFVFLVPLPFIAMIGGWLVREVGRQPWLVYGHLTVADAVGSVSTGVVLTSLILFTATFAVLAVVDYLLIARVARRGPDGVFLGTTLGRVLTPEGERTTTL
ncbi:cytochrome ubiquinol oxidase subunit I [Rhizohabitans arisaemae]|uniref:cytochrome ubiquinol oxidase subunit I n=1 Tax=Rhizohabitans arisaemae TaxID=2720610 RepID=UPI0031FEF353